MKKFHPLSFGLGLGSGVLVLLLVFGSMRAFGGDTRERFGAGPNGANPQQMRQNPAAMAERLGMTQAELQAELDSGKTMQDIVRERGIELPMDRGMIQGRRGAYRQSSGSGSTGTGSSTQSSSAIDPSAPSSAQ